MTYIRYRDFLISNILHAARAHRNIEYNNMLLVGTCMRDCVLHCKIEVGDWVIYHETLTLKLNKNIADKRL